jgi:hypothetical protein
MLHNAPYLKRIEPSLYHGQKSAEFFSRETLPASVREIKLDFEKEFASAPLLDMLDKRAPKLLEVQLSDSHHYDEQCGDVNITSFPFLANKVCAIEDLRFRHADLVPEKNSIKRLRFWEFNRDEYEESQSFPRHVLARLRRWQTVESTEVDAMPSCFVAELKSNLGPNCNVVELTSPLLELEEEDFDKVALALKARPLLKVLFQRYLYGPLKDADQDKPEVVFWKSQPAVTWKDVPDFQSEEDRQMHDEQVWRALGDLVRGDWKD